MLFVSVMAYRRRSLALALIAIGVRGQWIPWARIDRAAFQYHYYTALPFVILALAYFIAELWHGAVAADLAARPARGARWPSSARRCCGSSPGRCARSSDVESVNSGLGRPARRSSPSSS